MTEAPVITMQEVYKSRKEKTIGPINMELAEGYIYALVGHNGSGKSTLLNMLQKIVMPDSGRILWYGSEVEGELPPELREKISSVTEKSILDEDHMTAMEAAEFRAYWYPNWNQGLFEELLSKFEVPLKSKLKKMSKGERRKYEIAAALAAQPRLLILDEPSSGLDPFSWKQMITELQRYMDLGNTTVIIATHILDEIRRLADYIILMHRGHTLGMAEKDLLLDSWREIWYEGDIKPAHLPGIVDWSEETGSIRRIVTTHTRDVMEILSESGITPVKARILELDEILAYWIEGYGPAGWETKKGEKIR
ncbi:multidrug ABC transporter ATP-binding protein [Paenibacillus sp. FSL H7-0326]|uniref:ATP-binding cassette domain-containing protein n=1 Tax=Paenibacillus sp. FSL H7-0326 TaxID=1921144 RepID=UPI00096CF75F|nr:ABC transporter ATP-binding protein [Paenibacillus sp. FSL H7-0326]OMC65451.1 multidrug ABC transporter ATP-binding protein [Paenibacillus sp. FSL H7-0326]